MPVSAMVRMPFHSFAVPGLLLLFVFGMLPLLVLYGLWKQPQWAWSYALTPFKERHAAWSFFALYRFWPDYLDYGADLHVEQGQLDSCVLYVAGNADSDRDAAA
ncbi:hypothetical protein ACFSQ7_48980 [Paenibacillus rhizoplanae]